VDVTVVNQPGNCADTLPGGLIYEPGDTTCVASSTIEAPPPAFPPANAGSCSSGDLIVSNGGAGTLEVYQMSLQGRFFFDSGASSQTAPGFQVPPFGSAPAVAIYFCPDVDTGATYTGNLSIQNNSPANPFNVTLSADEASPILGVSSNTFAFGDQAASSGLYTEALTITNTGSAPLNWSLSGSNSTVYLRTAPAGSSGSPVSSGTVAAGGSQTVHVTLNTDSGATGPVDVVLTVTADEPDAQGSPQDIQVTANITTP
jgi:hypothetical protein